MNNKLQYHLIPTEGDNKVGALMLNKSNGSLVTDFHSTRATTNHIPRELYLTSDAEIKEGDWAVVNKIPKKAESIDVEILKTHPHLRIRYPKIEFTTDPKLIADGVSAIDGKTKALISPSRGEKINFLEEFCKRYNQKDNKKVDVEKLAENYADDFYDKNDRDLWSISDADAWVNRRDNFIEGYNQALQSQAGGFSLELLMLVFNYGKKYEKTQDLKYSMENAIKDFQSLTKEQPKGEPSFKKENIVIECEMELGEEVIKENTDGIKYHAREWKIKLKDGQPTLIFK